jgi:hypothetical protein
LVTFPITKQKIKRIQSTSSRATQYGRHGVNCKQKHHTEAPLLPPSSKYFAGIDDIEEDEEDPSSFFEPCTQKITDGFEKSDPN